MLLYWCKVIGCIGENIHQNLPENMVRILWRPSAALLVHLVTTHLGETEKERDGLSLTKFQL
uniref:Uncharacterized protein n=1 Tax=Catagonus wagneri TaxID=51154 RepID=A0A8C3VGZ8_9CETA